MDLQILQGRGIKGEWETCQEGERCSLERRDVNIQKKAQLCVCTYDDDQNLMRKAKSQSREKPFVL